MNEKIQQRKVPEDKVPLLNFSVGDIFCRDRRLAGLVSQFHQNGIIRLGDLVALSEDSLCTMLPATAPLKDRIKTCLEEIGLELGMEVDPNSYVTEPGFPPRRINRVSSLAI